MHRDLVEIWYQVFFEACIAVARVTGNTVLPATWHGRCFAILRLGEGVWHSSCSACLIVAHSFLRFVLFFRCPQCNATRQHNAVIQSGFRFGWMRSGTRRSRCRSCTESFSTTVSRCNTGRSADDVDWTKRSQPCQVVSGNRSFLLLFSLVIVTDNLCTLFLQSHSFRVEFCLYSCSQIVCWLTGFVVSFPQSFFPLDAFCSVINCPFSKPRFIFMGNASVCVSHRAIVVCTLSRRLCRNKVIFLIISETAWASNFKIFQHLALYSLCISTVNFVTDCLGSAANRVSMSILGHV